MIRITSAIVLSTALVVIASCQSTDDGAVTSSAVSSSLPCNVDDVFARNCRRCHSSPPKFGAPMPLGDGANVRAPAPSDGSKTVATRIGERIHDPVAPMPQGGKLSAEDMATLDTWIAGGAPLAAANATTCATDGGTGVDAGAPAGPDLLPCPAEQRTTFLAHGAAGAAEPYALTANAGNLYMCFTWKAPWTTTTQATAFAPVIDDERVVHHWILYETATPQTEGGASACSMPFDAKFLQGWAPGGENQVMPENIGLGLPTSDRWLILQVHYWNAAGYTDVKDRSGVSMCTTTDLRPNTAVVSTLGSANILLNPRSPSTVVTGNCTPQITEPLHILGSAPHMHGRGRHMKTEILRGGSERAIEMLVDTPFDFQSQKTYPSSLLLQPGDRLRTSCTYENASDKLVTFGEKTEDEMCFNFVTVWPAPGIVNAGGRNSQRCIDK